MHDILARELFLRYPERFLFFFYFSKEKETHTIKKQESQAQWQQLYDVMTS